MNSIAGLIARLERAEAPDRRLDSEVTLALLQPAGGVVDPEQGGDGWDIHRLVDGEATYWREASDILPVTASLDAVCELIAELGRPDLAPAMLRGLRQAADKSAGHTPVDVVGGASRSVLASVFRVLADEGSTPAEAAPTTRVA